MSLTMEKPSVELVQATIGFCRDSGDGMQLVGTEFANASANLGNDISTFPDFPAEIRAPVGTLAGVSGFQVQFSSTDIYTPEGSVGPTVCRIARELGVGLITLGVHKSSFAREVFGTGLLEILLNAHCPVLSVRQCDDDFASCFGYLFCNESAAEETQEPAGDYGEGDHGS